MAEYIEREKAYESLLNGMAMTGYQSRALDCISEFSIPAADVRPVVRGHWIRAKGSWCTPGGDPVWECSECGKGRHVYGIEHGTYGADVADGQWAACPNCGADMRDTNDEKA